MAAAASFHSTTVSTNAAQPMPSSLREEEIEMQMNGQNEIPSDDDNIQSETGRDPVIEHAVAMKDQESLERDGFFARRAKSVGRRPWIQFWISFLVSSALSAVGIIVGDFSVSVDNAGWQSRGTLISDRHSQVLMVLVNRQSLFYEGEPVWEDLINNVQPGWEIEDDGDDDSGGDRRLSLSDVVFQPPVFDDGPSLIGRTLPFEIPASIKRHLQEDSLAGGLEGCDVSWYTSGLMVEEPHLWPLWRTKGDTISALDSQVIRDLCVAEEATQASLQAGGLCYGCSNGRCLPPYSLVFFARLSVGDINFAMACDELSTTWEGYMQAVQTEFQSCVADIDTNYTEGEPFPISCPFGFSPTLLDEFFSAENDIIRYTSSIFASSPDTEALFEILPEFDRASASAVVEGVYDTQYEDFISYTIDDSLVNDMILAMGSAGITALAMFVHTRSFWLTAVGLLQIVLSFPLAYFVYTLVARLEFFPFLNFIGIFVVFALGADDVFVAVDKWKNARLAHKGASTEEIAAIALPDAALAMFLTTLTTAVAFFATAICPVAPLKLFAVFCGLLVCFDYIMCVLLIFPALCIYDKVLMRGSKNPCISCHCCHRFETHGEDIDGEEAKPSLIRRILVGYYKIAHFLRWALLVLCLAAFGVCIYYATKLELPTSSDVRLLDSDNEFETNYEWRLNLLSEVLRKEGGSQGFVIWGVLPADTGDHNDPNSWTQLVLDESFDPSPETAQEYVAGFCEEFFSQDFAEKTNADYNCPINAFDSWLQSESASTDPSWEYFSNCGGATGLPVPQGNFHSCIIAWSQLVGQSHILHRNGRVRIILNRFQSRVRYDSPFDDLDSEWNNIESWMVNQTNTAPVGVNQMYFSSADFWWFDTNGQMLATAYGAAAIALGAAALVMLFSSRSLILTGFAIITIGFILSSVASMLAAIGWTLGFLESICIAIAIGISCDFVIHFAHAYSSLLGNLSRSERSKFALVSMGPSILAAAFTTICAATVMIFTVIAFFQKFAVILFFTILQATVGSFVFFMTLADCIGPSRPTYLVDLCVEKTRSCCCKKQTSKTKTRQAATPDRTEMVVDDSD